MSDSGEGRGRQEEIIRLVASAVPVALFAQLAGMVANLAVFRELVAVFGSSYGAYLAGSSMLGLTGMLELGIGLFTAREVAYLDQRPFDSLEWRRLLGTVALLVLVLSVAVTVLSLAAVPWVTGWFRIESASVPDLKKALALSALYWGTSILSSTVVCVVQGLRWLRLLSWLSISGTVVSSAMVIGCTAVWPRLELIPVGMMAGTVVTAVLAVCLLPAEIRRCLLAWPVPHGSVARSAYQFCRPFLLGKMFSVIKDRTDQPIAARFIGADAVVVYSSTLRLPQTVTSIMPTVGGLMFAPAASALAAGDKRRLKAAVLQLVRLGLTFGCVGAAIVWFANPFFVGAWVGHAWYGGPLLSLIFCGWILADCLQNLLGSVVMAAGATQEVTRYVAIGATLNLVLSLVLVRSLGLVGIAVGTLCGMVLGPAVLTPRAAFRHLGIGLGDLWGELRGVFLVKLVVCTGGLVIIGSAASTLEDSPQILVGGIPMAILVLAVYHSDIREAVRLLVR